LNGSRCVESRAFKFEERCGHPKSHAEETYTTVPVVLHVLYLYSQYIWAYILDLRKAGIKTWARSGRVPESTDHGVKAISVAASNSFFLQSGQLTESNGEGVVWVSRV